MAFACDICGKKRRIGNRVSHAHNKSKRAFYPNLKSVRAMIGGAARRVKICTRCLRSGLIAKPVRAARPAA
jgi:large subunit ribosomal protein L28